MSRRLNLDPLAVTTAGRVVVNVAHFDCLRQIDAVVERAIQERGRVLVAVELSRVETRWILEHLGHGQREAVARLVGMRQKRSHERSRGK
ncbi:MAG: hypothetical protein U0263_01550 [Polyangiaceae bacterium]